MSLEDKFAVISLTEKVKSHLLPDVTAKDRAQVAEDATLRSMIFRSRKSVMGKHLKSFLSQFIRRCLIFVP